jgi:hypothetical protein
MLHIVYLDHSFLTLSLNHGMHTAKSQMAGSPGILSEISASIGMKISVVIAPNVQDHRPPPEIARWLRVLCPKSKAL